MAQVVRLLKIDGDNAARFPSFHHCPHTLISGPLPQTPSETMISIYPEQCLGTIPVLDTWLFILLSCYHGLGHAFRPWEITPYQTTPEHIWGIRLSHGPVQEAVYTQSFSGYRRAHRLFCAGWAWHPEKVLSTASLTR